MYHLLHYPLYILSYIMKNEYYHDCSKLWQYLVVSGQ